MRNANFLRLQNHKPKSIQPIYLQIISYIFPFIIKNRTCICHFIVNVYYFITCHCVDISPNNIRINIFIKPYLRNHI